MDGGEGGLGDGGKQEVRSLQTGAISSSYRDMSENLEHARPFLLWHLQVPASWVSIRTVCRAYSACGLLSSTVDIINQGWRSFRQLLVNDRYLETIHADCCHMYVCRECKIVGKRSRSDICIRSGITTFRPAALAVIIPAESDFVLRLTFPQTIFHPPCHCLLLS